MTDGERKVEVGWLINAGTVTRGDQRLANFYLDLDAKTGVRVAADHKVVFDIVRGKLLRYGKTVGAVGDTGVTIGAHAYTIELTEPTFDVGLHDLKMYSWKLIVRRGDDAIVTSSKASSLCAPLEHDREMTELDQQNEVRRRVIYYLAWRELGM